MPRNQTARQLREVNQPGATECDCPDGLTQAGERDGFTDALAAAERPGAPGPNPFDQQGDPFDRGGFLRRPNGWER